LDNPAEKPNESMRTFGGWCALGESNPSCRNENPES
jgi:hypothetical protein